MRIYGLFVTRKDATDAPELVEAWDEWSIEENPDGYQDDVSKWRNAGDDIDAFAVVAFELPTSAVLSALYPEPVAITASGVSRVDAE